MLKAQPCIRVQWIEEDRFNIGLLDNLANIHHNDFLGHFGDHSHIMGDIHDRHPEFVLERSHQIQDLRFGGHIQGSGRLIGNQQTGSAAQRHGDHSALAHATTQLEGIIIDDLLRPATF